MQCVICDKETNNKLKNYCVCDSCENDIKKIREHLNSTRKNPRNNFNPSGDPEVTVREIILRGIENRRVKEASNEAIRIR